MTQDEIIEMAREADIDHHRLWNDDGTNRLEAFAKLVEARASAKEREKDLKIMQDMISCTVAVEREACAKLVEVSDELEDWEIICGSDGRELLNAMANAIRARGEA